MLNRRGHVPTLLLFAVALILIITAGFTMLSLTGDVDKEALKFTELTQNLSFDREYTNKLFVRGIEASKEEALQQDGIFRENFDVEFRTIFANIDKVSYVSGNIFEKIGGGEYTLTERAYQDPSGALLIYNLTIKDVEVESKKGFNELTSFFNMSYEFNRTILLS